MDNAFTVSTGTLYEFYKAYEHEACKAKLVDFIRLFGTSKDLRQLYLDFLSRSPMRDQLIANLPDQAEWSECLRTMGLGREKWSFLGSANQNEIMRQLLNNLDVTTKGNLIAYHFDRSPVSGSLLPSSCLVINQNVLVNYSNPDHRPFFEYFFSFMYGQTAFPKEFLEYHLSETFQDDTKRFSEFLMTINYGASHAREGYVDLLKSWLKEKMTEGNVKSLSETFTEPFRGLADIVPSKHHYAYLVRELSKWGYLDRSGTFVYKGKDRAATAIALLETFINHQFTNPAFSWTVDMKSRFLKEAWGINVSPTSSSFRSMLAKQRKRFASLALANQITE